MGAATHLGAVLLVAIGAAVAGPLAGTAGRAAEAPVVVPARASAPQTPSWVFVEVTPGTVQPGYLVGIRASCVDNSVPAIVVSDAFGRVAVHPERGILVGTPMVRERTWPGNYRVKLECRDGATATTMLQVVKKPVTPTPTPSPSPSPPHPPTRPPTHAPAPHPSKGPNTGFGGGADDTPGGLLLPGGLALTVAGVTIALVTSRRPRARRGAYRR